MKSIVVLLGLAGLGGFSYVSWHSMHGGIANELTRTAQIALDASDLKGVSVAFDHLDGIVSGADTAEKKARAERIILTSVPAGRVVFTDDAATGAELIAESSEALASEAIASEMTPTNNDGDHLEAQNEDSIDLTSPPDTQRTDALETEVTALAGNDHSTTATNSTTLVQAELDGAPNNHSAAEQFETEIAPHELNEGSSELSEHGIAHASHEQPVSAEPTPEQELQQTADGDTAPLHVVASDDAVEQSSLDAEEGDEPLAEQPVEPAGFDESEADALQANTEADQLAQSESTTSATAAATENEEAETAPQRLETQERDTDHASHELATSEELANEPESAEPQETAVTAAPTVGQESVASNDVDSAPPNIARLGVFLQADGSDSVVKFVENGSAAHRAGVRVGDTIVRFGDHSVSNITDLVTAIRPHQPGDSVAIWYQRQGNVVQTRVRLHKLISGFVPLTNNN